MNTRTLATLVIALAASTPALASDYALLMPTGVTVNCSDLGSVRFTDMPHLFGVNNFSKEYEQYVKFRTFAPHDCERAEIKAGLAARNTEQPWRLVAGIKGTEGINSN